MCKKYQNAFLIFTLKIIFYFTESLWSLSIFHESSHVQIICLQVFMKLQSPACPKDALLETLFKPLLVVCRNNSMEKYSFESILNISRNEENPVGFFYVQFQIHTSYTRFTENNFVQDEN